MQNGFWDDAEVISVYDDDQATDDGFLVALRGENRLTHAALAFLARDLPEDKPPTNWTIDMMGWFRAKDPEARAIAAATGLVDVCEPRARAVWAADGVFELYPIHAADGKVRRLEEFEPPAGSVLEKLWIIPNELGGVTLMLPSDY